MFWFLNVCSNNKQTILLFCFVVFFILLTALLDCHWVLKTQNRQPSLQTKSLHRQRPETKQPELANKLFEQSTTTFAYVVFVFVCVLVSLLVCLFVLLFVLWPINQTFACFMVVKHQASICLFVCQNQIKNTETQ